MSDVTFNSATEAVIEKVRKLLALAKNNDNEHQAEAATNKARELLEAYNLDLAVLNKESNDYVPRDKQKAKGGLYKWQRDLWNMTATLNFCRYWYVKGTRKGSTYEHELLGSKVNVLATRIMAQYLQDAVERVTREWMTANRPGMSIFIKEAIAYREGVTERLVDRMWRLRQDRIKAEDAKRKAEREANAAQGIFTENALVISDVISTEEDLNTDHIWGYPPGTSARNRKEREARREVAEREAEELLRKQAEWDAANPEEAAARKAKEEAEEERKNKEYWEKYKAKKRHTRRQTPEEERRSMRSFRSGYNKGDEISLDQQLDQDKRRLN